jgi:hypothetical protein
MRMKYKKRLNKKSKKSLNEKNLKPKLIVISKKIMEMRTKKKMKMMKLNFK